MMDDEKELSLEEQLGAAVVARKELFEMIESKGWKRLMAMVQEQQDDSVRTLVLVPLQTLDEVAGQEFRKGRIAQMMEIAMMPETYIQTLDSTISTLTHQLESQNEQASE